MKKRILVISWFFPPINSSEGLVTLKLLNNSEYEYDVYMQANNESWSYGTSEDIKVNDNVKRIKSEAKSLDEFKEQAEKYFADNMDKYDIVMTRSMPEASHIIGLAIKKMKPSIFWIASFGDPIGNNPFTLKSLRNSNPYSLKQRYERPMGIKEILSPFRILRSTIYERNYRKQYRLLIEENNILQKKIINTADYIIYNSSYQKDYMLKDYNNKEELDQKSLIIPHSYDETLYKNKTYKNDKIIFTYVGSLDDIRTPKELFKALNNLYKLDPELNKKVEFRFYGNMSDKEKIYLIDNDLLNIVKVKKNINYLDSLAIMEEADWLILIDANISEVSDQNIFFAAKIADYIGANRKILGITMLEGASAEILHDYNCLCLENNAEEIFNYLYLIIYECYTKNINADYRKKYDAKNVAKTFDNHIAKLCKGDTNEN